MECIEMTYDEFHENYRPTDEFFSDGVKALKRATNQDYHYVWTVVDTEGRYTAVSNGLHWVNRLEYIITEVPWEDENEIWVSND